MPNITDVMHPSDLRKTALMNSYKKRQGKILSQKSLQVPSQEPIPPAVLPPLQQLSRPASTIHQNIYAVKQPVITMRDLRRRTTTSLDFTTHRSQLPNLRNLVCSPTRRSNPQPNGLVYQCPYNRFNRVYGIWNPNVTAIQNRLPAMIDHLRDVNFSCKHPQHISPEKCAGVEPFSYTADGRSSYRESFQRPNLNLYGQIPVQPTRYGNRPSVLPAVGIVPNSITLAAREKSSRKIH